ncbi:MAG: flagellar basal body P-ring formation chaperone FlgA [Desulfobacula sp.]|nr:flagellar basal body P-ring formation chaperone FlgA [Desulfobacula sp.]
MITFRQKSGLLLLGVTGCLILHLYWIVPIVFADNNMNQADQVRIEVRTTNQVNATRFFLGDIADITSSPFLSETIKNIDIAASPKPGKIIVIDKRKIVFKLKSQKYLSDNLTLVCPDKIFVKRIGQNISKQQIEDFIHQQLEIRFPDKAYQLKQLKIRGLEPYPKGVLSFDFISDKFVNRKGRLAGYLDVVVDGVKSGRLSLSGTVTAYKNIIFAARSLSKGNRLSPEDVYIKKGNVFDFNPSALHAIDQTRGKILKTSVKKDTSLILSMLSDPPLIKKGDIVTIIVKNKNLEIVTSGISKEDGFINELIKVENFHSGRLVRGIVKEKFKVEVVY